MKCVWYEEIGSAEVLHYGDMPMPVPATGEVLVKIHASGVNPSDVKIRGGARGDMPFARQIPHSDGAGVVEAAGDQTGQAQLGRRVWLWNAAIGRTHGTCAEYIALPASQTAPLPATTDFAAGACFGVPLMTAAYGVHGDGVAVGRTVLVAGGAGAVGHYAVQLARLAGAQVITTVSSEQKSAHAASAQPDYIINYKTEDVAARVLKITDGRGVDKIIEVEFGGNLVLNRQILKAGGVIAAYGSAAVPEPTLPFYPLMFNNASLRMFLIYKISAAARRRMLKIIDETAASLTHSIAQVLPLQQTRRAHEMVESGAHIGNIVVCPLSDNSPLAP